MSPLAQRRFAQFKVNKRGFFSLIILAFILILTLGAEFVANDCPLLVRYKGGFYFPVFKNYPETTFGGTFETAPNYKDPELQALIKKEGWMIFPLIPFGPHSVNEDLQTPAPSKPSFQNWLGTDDQGRDVLARLLYGFRMSLVFSVILTTFSSIVGIFFGAIQGYYGGRVDLWIQRIIEIWNGLPTLFLIMLISSLFAPTALWLLAIMLFIGWPALVQVVRAEFLRARTLDYVRAAEALGAPTFYLMRCHILPNAWVSVLTYWPFLVSASITLLTALDFLGFGLPPGSPSLGELVTQGKNNIQAPWLGLTAFFAIALLLSLLIFIGEAIRDAFDPRKTSI